VALIFLAPLAAGALGVLLFVAYWLHDAVVNWRDDHCREPYIPSRVWFDQRYGGTDGDPARMLHRADFPHVPTEGDPGRSPSIQRHRARP